jgi:hypothetical protein
MAASVRLDTLPGELLRAELRLARADHQAAQATLRAAEASLAARVDLDGPDPDAAGGGRHPTHRGARPKGPGRAAPPEASTDAQEGAPEDRPGTPGEGGAGAEPDQATANDDADETTTADDDENESGEAGAEPAAAAADRPVAVAGSRRVADEQWVRDCRSAAERAERRARELQAAVDRARDEPVDEAAHRGFAKRVVEARDAIERAREASNQAELDLIQASELARVALEGLAAARAGSDWRALEHARQARTTAAGAIGPAWEASRWAGLRVARAEYELDRLVEDRLAGAAQPSGGPNGSMRGLP